MVFILSTLNGRKKTNDLKHKDIRVPMGFHQFVCLFASLNPKLIAALDRTRAHSVPVFSHADARQL
jgi:hypothetical protein